MSDTDVKQSAQATEMPVNIISQYIRDISFENPNAPDSLSMKDRPEMDVSIGLDARKLEENKPLYEVVLSARTEALAEGKSLFICELQYGVTLEIDPKVEEASHHPLLFIEIPRIIFPYVREIVSSVVGQGGFPPLYLTPVDFHQLYLQRFGDDIKKSQEAAGNA